MKYKPGDRVIIASKEVLEEYSWKFHKGFCINTEMLECCNKVMTIKEFFAGPNYHYYMIEDGQRSYWRDEFISRKYSSQLELFDEI